MSRDNVLGVVIAAGAIVLAAWYLRKTQGGLFPVSTGLLSAQPFAAGSPASVYANGAFLGGGGCGCGCNGNSVPNGQGYQATATFRPAGNPPTVGGM